MWNVAGLDAQILGLDKKYPVVKFTFSSQCLHPAAGLALKYVLNTGSARYKQNIHILYTWHSIFIDQGLECNKHKQATWTFAMNAASEVPACLPHAQKCGATAT